MTGTSINEIFDLTMMTLTDYRLTNLFDTSEEDFSTFMESWLQFAIVDFYVCNQSLEYDNTTKEFPEILTRDNKVILATLMTKYWLQKSVNDITQLNLHITDRDFKVASEAQNLREKTNALNVLKEQCSQLLNDYSYRKLDWDTWLAQDFAGS